MNLALPLRFNLPIGIPFYRFRIRRKRLGWIRTLIFFLIAFFAIPCLSLWAQTSQTSPTPSANSLRPSIKAELVDNEKNFPQRNAKVKVSLERFQLIDPAAAQEKPKKGQGHLHYQVDQGFVIATPSPQLSLHELSRGAHQIKITLVGNDHAPLPDVSPVTLNFTIP